MLLRVVADSAGPVSSSVASALRNSCGKILEYGLIQIRSVPGSGF